MSMYMANKWGPGQLFALSGLDGKTSMKDDFVGILSGDRLGIRFQSRIRRELAVIPQGAWDLSYEIVTGDCISAVLNQKKKIRILYQDTNRIIGELCSKAEIFVFTEGKVTIKEQGEVCLQDTGDGEYTALAVEGSRFAFVFDREEERAIMRAREGLSIDMEEAYQKKWAYYAKYQLEDPEYGKLYSKCVSVMKTQVYAPEGRFGQYWSTPDRLPHRKLWLWDSVFHAIGYRNLDADLAEQLILSVLDTQQEDGMIPHMADPESCSRITQPPVLAWGAWKVYEMSQNKTFLQKIFDTNRKFLEWCDKNRRPDQEALYAWLIDEDLNCRCGESGMDNSPRFDCAKVLQAPDFSCFMANEMRYMEKIARELECAEDYIKEYEEAYGTIAEAINRKLWDSEDGFYYDYSVKDQALHKVEAVSSFLPLFAGVCTGEQAQSLVSWLKDPAAFGSEFPVPSISARHETYGTDMWRGPVWLNYNYFIMEGLEAYGFHELAEEIRCKTLKNVKGCYERTGCIFEYYDPDNVCEPWSLNRKGVAVEPYDFRIRMQSIRDYGWSCCLALDAISRRKRRKVII